MTLTAQQQGNNECYPTAVCMLMGKPWPEVRAKMLEHFHTPWGKTDVFSGSRGEQAKMLFELTGAPRELYGGMAVTGVSRSRGRAPQIHIPKSGRGMLTIYKRKTANRVVGHAMAYDNGVVYDPSDGRDHAEVWMKYAYRGWRVARVIPMPEPQARMTPEEARVHDQPVPFRGCR